MAGEEEKKYKDAQKELKKLYEQYKKLSKQKNLPLVDVRNLEEANAAIKQFSDSIEEVQKESAKLADGWGGVNEEIKGVIDELKKGSGPVKSVTSAFVSMGKIVEELKFDQQGIQDLSKKQVLAYQEQNAKLQDIAKEEGDRLLQQKGLNDLTNLQFQKELESLRVKGQITEQEEAIARGAHQGFAIFEDINQQLEWRLMQEEKYEKALGLTGAAAKGVNSIIKKIGFGALADQLGLDDAFEVAAQQAKKMGEEVVAAKKAELRMEELTLKALEDKKAYQALSGKVDNKSLLKKKQLLKNMRDNKSEQKDINGLYEGQYKTQITATDKMKVGVTYIKELGKNLIKNLGPAAFLATLMNKLWESIVGADKAAGDLAKQYGVSYKEGLKMVQNIDDIVEHTEREQVTREGMLEAQAEMNKLLGATVQLTGDEAAEWASIKKTTNLSNEALAKFKLTSMLTGKTMTESLEAVKMTTYELNSQHGTMIGIKEVQEGIAKAGSAFTLTMGNNEKKIAAAVIQAKFLGMELADIEGISSSILDFEGSIQSELEAELLTGKQLNLEKARAAALAGDLGKVAEEIKKQVGSEADFRKMNVIQQEALAKAVGMTRDQLSKSLLQEEKNEALRKAGFVSMAKGQEKYNELRAQGLTTDEAAKEIGDLNLSNQFESTAQADKLAEVMTRLQAMFTDMAAPILDMVDGIMEMVGGAENLASIIKWMGIGWAVITGTMKVYAGWQTAIIAYETTKAFLMKAQAAAALTTLSAATVGIGTVVAIAAAALAIGALVGWMSAKDAVIDPEGGLVVSGEKGSISLDKDDSIIAGTNLGGDGSSSIKEKSTAILTSIKNELSAQNILLQKILNKPLEVNMDGNKVGTQLALSNPAMQ